MSNNLLVGLMVGGYFMAGLFIAMVAVNADNGIIDGNRVYIDDSKVYISAEPHTIRESQYVYFNLTSKTYSGNIDVVFGFNTTVTKPKDAFLYDGIGYNDVTDKFQSVDYNYSDMTKWYYVKDVAVTAGQNYLLKSWINMKMNTTGKYWVCVKPSSETIGDAIANSHFYCLDPWWNNTFQRKKALNVSTGVSLTNYPLFVNITKDSEMQSDYSDLRIVNSSEDGELPFWIEKASTSWVTIWINGSWSSANGTQAYVYYSNTSVVTSKSNATAVLGQNISRFYPLHGDVNEYVSRTYNLTAYQSTATTGRRSLSNEAYLFDGTDDRLYGDDTGLPSGTNNNSACAWVYYDSQSDENNFRAFLSYGTRSNNQTREYAKCSSAYSYNNCFTNYGFAANSGSKMPRQSWQFVCYSANGTYVKMYANGTYLGTGEQKLNTVLAGSSGFTIGSSIGDDYFKGKIQEVLYWDRVISDTEVSNLYALTEPTYTFGSEEAISSGISDCALGGTTSRILYLKNEISPFDTINGTMNIYIDYGSGEYNSTAHDYNKSICITPSESNYTVDGQIEYFADNYTYRSYFLDNVVFDNTSQPLNLYLISNATGALIKITVKDQYLSPESDVYVQIQRYYPELMEYKVVAVLKTDNMGETNTYLVPYDVYYRFIVTDNGTTLTTTGAQLITSSSITISIAPTSIMKNYYNKIIGSVSYNQTTGNFTATYSDSSGDVEYTKLEIYRIGALEKSSLCNTTNTTIPSGQIICNIGNVSGEYITYKFTAKLSTGDYNWWTILQGGLNEEYWTSRLFGNCRSAGDMLKCQEGLWITMTLMITAAALGSFSPPASMTMLLVAMGVSAAIGLYVITVEVFIGFCVVLAIIIFRMRQS